MGSENIKDRLTKHANPNEDFMTKFKKYNEDNNTDYDYKSLLVAYAKVDNEYDMRGIEKYLGNILTPEIGERFPDEVSEIEVDFLYFVFGM